MSTLILLLAVNFSPGLFRAPELQHFPSDYFNQTEVSQLQGRVLNKWPGPSKLVEIWEKGDLTPYRRAVLLIGGAAYHNPQMLPIYRQAIFSKDLRVAQAAAWGYRNLIGDLPPTLTGSIPEELRRALASEIDAVMTTTRRGTLVQMWLASALAAEGKVLPGWKGVVFRRPSSQCLQAAARLIEAEDLPDVILAYETTEDTSTKVSLTTLLESLTLQRFIIKPKGPHAGWGSKIYDEAFERVDLFLENNCRQGGNNLVKIGLSQLGVRGLDPNAPAACDVWLHILDMPEANWWPLASHYVYRCGGPASLLIPGIRYQESNKSLRKWMLSWYGY